MNQGLVVSKWYWAPRYSLFERVHENLKHEVREEICIENHSKQVGRDQMFGGAGSEGIPSRAKSVSQVQESQIWQSPARSVGGGLIKGTTASASTSV